MYLAFYKKPKTAVEKLIKFFTRSNYVHCEIVTVKLEHTFYGYASDIGVGVCARWKEYKIDDWEFIKIDDCKGVTELRSFYQKTKNRKYDYLGVLGFVLGTPQNPKRYFCSEWCAEFLGVEKPYKVTPAKLKELFSV